MSLDIVFVTETFPPEVNGVAMTVGRLVDGMRQRGHRVSVIRPRQGAADTGSEFEQPVSGLPLPGYPGLRFGLPAGRMLARQWRLRRPDLVHVVTEGPLGWSAVSTARRLGIPVTSGFHTNFDRYSVHYGVGWLRPAVAAYLRTLHRRTQATMVPTEALAADLAGEGLSGVRVVGRGVDTQLFDPTRRSALLRQAWGVPEGGLACLYVGRMAAEKNLALVEKSFAAIQSVRPDARLIWVGDGPAAAALRLRHDDHCFAGVRLGESLATHYASADFFLFPSLSETYGNVVAEAMASGLPVLAYRSAAAAELIRDGLNGRLVSPGDETQYLESALDLARAGPLLLSELAAAARLSIMPRNWASVVERFESVAREAMGSSGAGLICPA
ncbi:glycosyltransferase family 1 protein [Dechloromonas denitrificans]|jgi:glycosyltransferase involved in cell wall biosynthesis|uniref:glycosyltransferase family 4 protein n=1 Tax=Dechloromonas denitrificans TaxID=281362 RepID=UPI001CF87099|nr:glycosyltransferase family 1 protein [Dechloromonas denitrificans]UCV11139.1 glycosyltransferase family 1 protein [Dechloromonas denitrificans]